MAVSPRLRLALGVSAAAVLLAGSGCVDIAGAGVGRFVDRQEKTFSTTGTPDIDLSTFDGAIEIRPWDKAQVLVVIEKRAANKDEADAIDVRAEQRGNEVTID